MPPNRLREFKSYVRDFRGITKFLLTGTIALPFVDLFLRVGPPLAQTGPNTLPAVTSSLLEVVVLMYAFEFWRRSALEAHRKRLRACALVCLLGLAAYVFSSDTLTFETNSAPPVRYVRGFVVRDDVRPLLNTAYTEDDALRDAEWEPTAVWTRSSVATVKLLLLGTWLVTFGSASAFVAAFVIRNRALHGREKRPASRPERGTT